MALAKSVKMYLTIFVATTCIYMVLYQYHISRQPLPSPDLLKNKNFPNEITNGNNKNSESSSSKPSPLASKLQSKSSLMKKYNLYLWSPISLLATQKKILSAPSAPSPSSSSATATSLLSLAQTSSNNATAPLTSPLLASSSSSSSSQVSSSSSLTLVAAAAASPSVSSAATFNSNSSINKSNVNMVKISSVKESDNNQIGLSHNNKNKTTNLSSTTTTLSTSRSSISARITAITTTKPTKSTTAATTRTTIKPENNANTVLAVLVPPPLYIITPTYRRPEQLAELTRLGYTLKHIINLLWLVIEDANKTSPLVTQTLNRIGVPYEYFVAPMPEEYKKTKKAKPRGVSNRNRGLEWLRANATEGVFYFADDDNTYDISIFEQMRFTKKVSMWPVGLVTKYGVSSPIVRKGKLDGFYDGWIGGRKYPVDMAGFAVSVQFLHERPKAKMPFKPGYEEDGFLKSLAPLNNTEIELLASECTEILTWHTQTKKNSPAEKLNMTKYSDTNLVSIDRVLLRP